MTYLPLCGPRPANLQQLWNHRNKAALALCLLTSFAPAARAITPTSTALAISSTTVAYKSPVLLTASVSAAGAPVTSGLVLFCDAAAPVCGNSSAVGTVQLTTGATAVLRVGSGPLGTHSYKAIYRPNNLYAASTSNTVTYSVTGNYASNAALTSAGSVGNYTLSANVVGLGSVLTGPTGDISFLDTSSGNNLLATEPLGLSSLSQAFLEAPGSPFSIATTTTIKRSVALASAYLTSDNNLDVVTGDAQGTITVLLGNGDGTFKPKVNYPGCPSGVALKILLSDFNRDGNTDVALGCSDGTNGSLTILLGNGDGTFGAPVQYAAGDVVGLALGDFNGDGILDVAVSNRSQRNLMVFAGNGDGTFHTGVVAVSASASTHDVVVGDFNADGRDDLVYAVHTATANSSLSDLYLATGNGDGTFQTSTLIASNLGEFLTVGDTNADNFPDIVSTTITLTPHVGNSLFVLVGKGDGTFQPPVTYISDIPSDPNFADVNGDGKVDIIAGGSTGALVYLGNGDGTFQPYIEPTIGDFALTYAVNAGDYNGDGNADLIGTDAGSPRAAASLSQVQQTATTAAISGIAVFPLGSGTHNVVASYAGDAMYTSSISSTVPLLAAPAPTTLALTPSPAAGTLVGQSVTLTATLSPYAVGPPNTTTDGEIVKFFNGAALLGSGTLASGVATISTTTLPAGSDALKAVFAGDPNYNQSNSSTVTVTVAALLLSSSLDPSTFGQSVTFTATLAPGETGTVTFMDGATILGTAPIVGTTATLTTATLSAGPHDISGQYSGDGTHNAGTSPVLAQQVGKLTPTVAVTTTGPSTFGSSVAITATVPAGTTGTITFASGAVILGSGTVTASGSVTVNPANLPVGADPIVATYSGDSNNNGATGTVTQTVAKATPTLAAPTATPTSPTTASPVTITQTIPPGVSGPVSFFNGPTLLGTAPIVSGSASLTVPSLPLGSDVLTSTTPGDANNNPATSPATTVTVVKATPSVAVTTSGPSTYGSPVTITATVPAGTTGTVTLSSNGTTLGTGSVSAAGTVTITTSALPTGSDTISASYGGDANNNPSAGSVAQVVSKISPTLGVTTSGASTYGSPVTITAALPPGSTGEVSIASGGVILGSGNVTAGGTFSVTASTLPAGSDPIVATYAGDTNTNPATGSVTQSVAKASPTSVLSSSLNPATAGASVTLTDTLPPGATGTVTFSAGGASLGTATISNGVATVTTSTLPVSSVLVTATYNGDANNNTSVATLTQNVRKASPTLTLTTSGPASYGSPVTITASLPAGATGTVTLVSGGVPVGSGTVTASGSVTITTSSLPVGTDTLIATYTGDASNNDASATATLAIAKASPVVNLTASANPITANQTVTFTASVPANATGTVSFMDGLPVIGSGTVVNGQASFSTSTLTVGTHSVTASYGGDANNNAENSPPLAETVNRLSPSLPPPAVSSSNVDTETPVTISESVPPGTPGPVSFYDGATLLGTATIVNGVATLTVPALPAGTDPITAATPADASNNAAVSPATLVNVSKITPQLPAPTVSSTNLNAGTPLTITESIPTGVTGTISFYSGSTLLGTAPVVSGAATLTVSTAPVGSDPITVATPAGPVANSATSPATVVNVSKAAVTVGLSSSANPAVVNQAVTFTAVIGTGGTGTGVTGVVTFFDGATILGTGNLSAGVATFTTSGLSIGSHPVTAHYDGDSNNGSAISAVVSEIISKGQTSIVIAESTPAELLHTAVTFSARVSASGSSPTGTVTFMDGTAVLGSAAITAGSADGTIFTATASMSTSSLASGTHQITAVYSGDASFAGSSSAPTTNTVEDFTNTAKGTTAQNIFPGASTTYAFTMAPVGSSTFLEDVALTVDGLPPGTTYSFSPAVVAAGAGASTVTLTVHTSSSLEAQNRRPSDTPRNHLPITFAAIGIAGLGVIRKRRRQIPRMLLLLLVSLASLLPIASLSGCGGGYFGLTPKTYNVSVTGTEGTVQHTAAVTLVVQ